MKAAPSRDLLLIWPFRMVILIVLSVVGVCGSVFPGAASALGKVQYLCWKHIGAVWELRKRQNTI